MYTFLAFALTLVAKANAATHHCYHNYQLRGVLNIALPGDDILLFPGRFIGNFDAYNNGLPDNPITIRSQDPNNKAIIDGITYDDQSTIGLYVAANYYKIKNLIVENANKGIVFDNSLGSEVVDCEVRKTGEEAIHVRDGSSDVLIERNFIHNTGLFVAGYGEAIYVGSDKSIHYFYNPEVSFVTIRDNMIGPDVRAEGIDVKEGTHDVLIENNDFDATGLTGANSADSFIDLKGARTVVRYNTFNQNGSSRLKKGISVIDRRVDNSSHDHVIAHNTFNLDSTSVPMVRANKNTENVHVIDNTRSRSGKDYIGHMSKEGPMPSWATEGVYSEGAPLQLASAESARIVDIKKSYTIYANNKVNDVFWNDRSANGFILYHHSDGGSHQSAIYAQLEPNGKVHFEANGADLTGLNEVRFFIRSTTPDTTLRLKVNGISGHIRPDEEWHDHTFPFWLFMKGKEVKSIMFENISDKQVSLLFDDIRFTE